MAISRGSALVRTAVITAVAVAGLLLRSDDGKAPPTAAAAGATANEPRG